MMCKRLSERALKLLEKEGNLVCQIHLKCTPHFIRFYIQLILAFLIQHYQVGQVPKDSPIMTLTGFRCKGFQHSLSVENSPIKTAEMFI